MRLKSKQILYLSKLSNRWKLGVTAVFLYSVIAVSVQASEYIKNLEGLKDIRINGRWVEKHYALAMDNPVDRAKRSGKPSMVEFGATGCIPCDRMQPILVKLRKKYPDRLNVVFVNVRENQILGARFGIRSIPVQVFYDRFGKEVFRHVGFFAEAEVNKQLKKMGFP